MPEQNQEQEKQKETRPTGIPNVAVSRQKPKKLAGALFILIVLVIGGGGIYWAYQRNARKTEATAAQKPDDLKVTSRKKLELSKLPEPVETVPSEPVLVPPPAVPAQTALQVPSIHNGEPVMTLSEKKYAASLMPDGVSRTATPVQVTSGNDSNGSLTGSDNGKLGGLLEPVRTDPSSASVIKDRNLTIAKGTFIDCILQTRLDTTVPGMASCVIPRNVYSDNGKVLLLEKGSQVTGEYQGAVQNGLNRIFVLWTRIKTPHGVLVNLDSPAADALGGAGLPGEVNYHWWKRFGNALLFTLIEDAFQYGMTRSSDNNGGVNYYSNTQTGMERIIEEAMRQSGNIPPTLTKNQGERIGIYVARDLYFGGVYALDAI